MTYHVTFQATDDADWTETIALVSASDGSDYDLSAMDFTLKVNDGGSIVLSRSTTDSTITMPDDYSVRWTFTPSQLSALCPGKDYAVGMTMTDGASTTQIFIGVLKFVDGVVA